jgi:CPA2 family monovalent cation:H+ antiporter-2
VTELVAGGWLAAAMAKSSPLLGLLTTVLVLAVVVSLLLVRFRQSLLVGYFLCGVVIANSGLLGMQGTDPHAGVIGQLAELGVILLMFTLGIEFSIGELRHMWRTAVAGGGLQVAATGLLAAAVAWLFGIRGPELAVLAVALAISSTAVAMKALQDLGQSNNPGARLALGVALFQDLFVILFFLILPALLGNGRGSLPGQLGLAVGKGVVFLAGAFLLGQYGITPLLHAVARTRSRELFTLTVIGLCAGVALAAEALGLGFALGAFAAGLVVSESIYSHRILNDILPFKNLFLTVFFVSVGLMIDLPAAVQAWWQVLLGTAALLAAKGLVVTWIARGMKLPLRPALLAGASLASSGEFSLVLLARAGELRALDRGTEQLVLVCTAVSMGMVPALMRVTGPLAKALQERGWFCDRRLPPADLKPTRAIREMRDHAVICGYGPVGRTLNEALRRCGIDTLVIELNVDTVRELKQAGQPVLFADATHVETIGLAGLDRARLIAFTFPHVEATCTSLQLVRTRNPGLCVFARAKFPAEAQRLEELGAHVIHDERESAVAMIAGVMTSYERAEIDAREVVREVLG